MTPYFDPRSFNACNASSSESGSPNLRCAESADASRGEVRTRLIGVASATGESHVSVSAVLHISTAAGHGVVTTLMTATGCVYTL